MVSPLSILIIEDSTSDAELIVRQLEKDGFDVFHQRVETGELMRAALYGREWDAVLADYNVPGFGGIPALKLMQNSRFDLPFILVSGTIGEEAAIEVMRAGAHDFVMKDHLIRLAPILRREIDEAGERLSHRLAEEALRNSEARYRAITQSASDAIVTSDEEGIIRGWNIGGRKIFGYSEEEALGQPLTMLMPQRFQEKHLKGMNRFLAGGASRTLGTTVTMYGLTRSGKEFPLELSLSQWETNEGRFFTGIIHDISKRMLSEQSLQQSEERFRALIEQSLAGIYISESGVYQYANPRMEQLLGYGPGKLVGLCVEDIVVEEDLPIVKSERDKLHDGATSTAFEVRAQRKDGSIITLGVQGSLFKFDGSSATIGMAQDISDKKHAEEKIIRYVAQLESAFKSSVNVATTLVEMRDPYTAGHQRRVAQVAVAIGAELGFDTYRQEGLRVAGHLHDVGKITIPAEILSKPGKLTAIEYQLIQCHSQSGYEVLNKIEFHWPVAQVARQHHERLDGSGYPQGLKGEEIILEARIMAVADVVEAMSSHRPYRPGLGIEAALAEIKRGRGTIYDPGVSDACIKLFLEKEFTIST